MSCAIRRIFGAMSKVRGLSQAEIEAVIKPRQAWEGTRVWGAVFSHRQACVRLLRDAVCMMLADPAITRAELRRRMVAIAKQIERKGPESVAEDVPVLDFPGE
jgi:hypothetical protein